MSEREREGEEALGRAMLSLEGLSCGDAFGERFFPRRQHLQRVRERRLPEATWVFTDDTMMAISVVEMLRRDGRIVEERLAEHFAELYDQRRGYGEAMHGLMRGLKERGGGAWREEAGALFGGEGSFGNGSAMRVAPLGAYFADDLDRLVEEARRSAVTTHSHAEAVAGAVGVAMGAAVAWRWRERGGWTTGEFLEEVRQRVPESVVREGIGRAMELPDGVGAPRAAEVLGNGSMVSAMDTVPFALWCAGRWRASFEDAMWETVSGGGDMDTTCAMVGGMVAMGTGVPEEWRGRREGLGRWFGIGWGAARC